MSEDTFIDVVAFLVYIPLHYLKHFLSLRCTGKQHEPGPSCSKLMMSLVNVSLNFDY